MILKFSQGTSLQSLLALTNSQFVRMQIYTQQEMMYEKKRLFNKDYYLSYINPLQYLYYLIISVLLYYLLRQFSYIYLHL